MNCVWLLRECGLDLRGVDRLDSSFLRERQKVQEQMKFKETVTHNIRQSALKMKL